MDHITFGRDDFAVGIDVFVERAVGDFAVNNFDCADFNHTVAARVFKSGCFNVKADNASHNAPK